MLCQKCKKNEATVYYKENINGHVTEYNLCPECAAELEKNGVFHLDSRAEDLFGERMFDFSPLISGFFGGALGAGKTEKRCPVCGSTFADIAKTGHIGCPECYNVFEKELSSTVNQLHGAAKPTGRSPKRFGEKHQREEEDSGSQSRTPEGDRRAGFRARRRAPRRDKGARKRVC